MEIPFLMLILVFEPIVVRLFWKNPIFCGFFIFCHLFMFNKELTIIQYMAVSSKNTHCNALQNIAPA